MSEPSRENGVTQYLLIMTCYQAVPGAAVPPPERVRMGRLGGHGVIKERGRHRAKNTRTRPVARR